MSHIGGGGGSDLKEINKDKMIIDGEGIIKRVRQYGEKNRGPFVVCVRAIDKPLLSVQITKFLHNTYKTTDIITKQINQFKMNVFFSPKDDKNENLINARNDANNFPKSDWNKKYRIYIPERLVEVIGCITLAVEQETNEILSVGEGKFRNTSIPNVKVLDAVRFERNIDEAGKEQRKEPTNTVRVVFEGLLLPEFLTVYNLLIPVREFKRKQMFCESCLKYNHTKSHCNNRPHKPVENEKKCIHCNVDDHNTGDIKCPKRIFLQKKGKGSAKSAQKKTYAEILQELDPNASMNNENSDNHFPLNLGTKNSRKSHQTMTQNTNRTETPIKKRKRDNPSDIESWDDEETSTPPPGFRNTQNDNDENEITGFIRSLIEDLDLPPFITQLILRFVIPFVNKILDKCTNSFLAKMTQFGSK